MKSIEIDNGGPVMPRSKSRATVRSLVSFGILEVAHARRADARVGQPVVEPRRGAVAEIRADRLMDRGQHLKEDEDDADEDERHREAPAVVDRADEHAGGDREHRGQRAAQEEHEPPAPGEDRVRFGQDREELPFLALTQSSKHLASASGCGPRAGRELALRSQLA